MSKAVVLLVDDNAMLRALMKALLESIGCRAITASNAVDGLALFMNSPVDAVVMDYDLPGTNGAQAALAMSRIKPAIPKLLFTSSTSISLEELWLFQGLCTKPASLNELHDQLRELVRRCGRRVGTGPQEAAGLRMCQVTP